MNRIYCSVSVLVLGLTFIVLSDFSQAEQPLKRIVTEKTWAGQVKIVLPNPRFEKGFVADMDSWAKLWKTYRGDEKMPEVDFDKELILWAVNTDPNRISAVLELNDQGELSVGYSATERLYMNPETRSYQIALIQREGIKTIDGKKISSEEPDQN